MDVQNASLYDDDLHKEVHANSQIFPIIPTVFFFFSFFYLQQVI